ncbi:MAG: hypothetical protein Crog4KO_08090 [Crocinitomicaceae bacterium]
MNCDVKWGFYQPQKKKIRSLIMNYLHLLLLISSLVLFQSCKKEPIATAVPGTGASGPYFNANYDHYNGNFYGVQTLDAQSFTSTLERDIILKSEVSGLQLLFQGKAYDLSDTNQTNFSLQPFYPIYSDLNFSSNFNQVSFAQTYDASVTYQDEAFDGERTVMAATNDSLHPLKDQLEGMFVLNVSKYENLNGVNLSGLDTLNVSMSGYDIMVNADTYNAGAFYTFYRGHWVWSSIEYYREVYWVEDSIYLNFKTVSYQSGTNDTVHHIYAGTRL